jgi:acyl-CoA synthetase (AMP-forming)/AMP-acid ligase II
LSSWDVAINGAEPIHQRTLDQFAAAFEPYGFRRQAFYPCYGLAESTLMVSGGPKEAMPVVRRVQKVAMEHHQIAIPCISKTGGQAIVGCGKSLGGQTIRIVDPETRTVCAPNQIGEIWVAGASVAKGYWNHPKATQDTFDVYLADTAEGPFLRTGDLGFMHQDELFITSRLKDVMIIRARTHYPQDIEATVEQCHPALRPHGGAAFAVEMYGEERLVVVQEVERRVYRQTGCCVDLTLSGSESTPQACDIATIVGDIRQLVAEKHDVQVSAVVLLRPGSIPKTSSGKIRRQTCREQFLHQTLDVVGQWHITDASGASAAERTITGEAHGFRELTFISAPPQQQGGHVA